MGSAQPIPGYVTLLPSPRHSMLNSLVSCDVQGCRVYVLQFLQDSRPERTLLCKFMKNPLYVAPFNGVNINKLQKKGNYA
jgi:hypothetical protein